MKKSKKIILILSITAIVTGISIYLYNSKKDKNDVDNLNLLRKNFGKQQSNNDSETITFNSGKNTTTFYKNGTFEIFDSKKQSMAKGSYKNGGVILILDNGKQENNTNVFTNLTNILKQI